MPVEARVRKIASTAVIASIIVAAIPYFINSRVSEGVPMLNRAADRQNAFTNTLAMLRDVETGQRRSRVERHRRFSGAVHGRAN